MIWFALLIPLLGSIICYILFKYKLTWWELAIPTGGCAFLIFIIQAISIHNLTVDTVYHGALITKARYYEYWETYVQQTCTTQYACGTDSKGNTTYCTQTYDCSYCYENNPYWEVYDTEGNSWRITEQAYNELKRRWKSNPAFVELNRHINSHGSCGKDGDAYEIYWDNDIYTSEPSTFDVTYTNKVQATKSAFSYPDISSSEAKNKSLYEYPGVSKYKQDAVLGLDSLRISEASKDSIQKLYKYFNGKYGKETHVRLFILLYYGVKGINTALEQEAYWIGGNRNELFICIDVNKQTNEIYWVKSFSWCDNKRLLVDCREDIMEMKYLDFKGMYPIIEAAVKKSYKPKDFEDFKYLNVQASVIAIIITFFLTIIATVFILYWGVNNEYNSEGAKTGYY